MLRSQIPYERNAVPRQDKLPAVEMPVMGMSLRPALQAIVTVEGSENGPIIAQSMLLKKLRLRFRFTGLTSSWPDDVKDTASLAHLGA